VSLWIRFSCPARRSSVAEPRASRSARARPLPADTSISLHGAYISPTCPFRTRNYPPPGRAGQLSPDDAPYAPDGRSANPSGRGCRTFEATGWSENLENHSLRRLGSGSYHSRVKRLRSKPVKISHCSAYVFRPTPKLVVGPSGDASLPLFKVQGRHGSLLTLTDGWYHLRHHVLLRQPFSLKAAIVAPPTKSGAVARALVGPTAVAGPARSRGNSRPSLMVGAEVSHEQC
jgi:hypothetical protein